MRVLKRIKYIGFATTIVSLLASCNKDAVPVASKTTVTTTATANTKYIGKTGVTEMPETADLDIDMSQKITGRSESKGYQSVDEVKAMAVYNALKQNDADVMVMAAYEVQTKTTDGETTISVSVRGYGAKYKNIKPIDGTSVVPFKYANVMAGGESDSTKSYAKTKHQTSEKETTTTKPVVKKTEHVYEVPKTDTVAVVKRDTTPTPVAITKTAVPKDTIDANEPARALTETPAVANKDTIAKAPKEVAKPKEEAPKEITKPKEEAPKEIAKAKEEPPKVVETPKPVTKSTPPAASSDAIVYKIQLMASKVKIASDKDARLAALPDYEVEQTDFFRYYTGHFSTIKEAQTYLSEVQKKGFAQAFVVAFKGTTKVPAK